MCFEVAIIVVMDLEDAAVLRFGPSNTAIDLVVVGHVFGNGGQTRARGWPERKETAALRG